MNGWIAEWIDGNNGQMDAWIDESMDRWMNGQMDVYMN